MTGLRPPVHEATGGRWVAGLVEWYNHEHRHSAFRFVTPAQRHAGFDGPRLAHCKTVYEAARRRHPQRWRGPTRNWERVQVVHLNPEQPDLHADHSREVENHAQMAA